MTPSPGPRPVVAIGCFVLFIFTLISVVVLGASLNDVAIIGILAIFFVVLMLALARILFRQRP